MKRTSTVMTAAVSAGCTRDSVVANEVGLASLRSCQAGTHHHHMPRRCFCPFEPAIRHHEGHSVVPHSLAAPLKHRHDSLPPTRLALYCTPATRQPQTQPQGVCLSGCPGAAKERGRIQASPEETVANSSFRQFGCMQANFKFSWRCLLLSGPQATEWVGHTRLLQGEGWAALSAD